MTAKPRASTHLPMATTFGTIMQLAVEATPGAIGGAFAAADGEMVDSYTTIDKDDWAILTAHYGIVLVQLCSAFGTWHFGSPEYFIAQHQKLDIVVHEVAHGYFALMAISEINGAMPLGAALYSLRKAAAALKKEIV